MTELQHSIIAASVIALKEATKNFKAAVAEVRQTAATLDYARRQHNEKERNYRESSAALARARAEFNQACAGLVPVDTHFDHGLPDSELRHL